MSLFFKAIIQDLDVSTSFMEFCNIHEYTIQLFFAGPRKPREPRNLTLRGARVVDGKLRVQIRWRQPFSDAPIQFYKVYWSRLIHGPTNTSVLVHHRTVPQVSSVLLQFLIKI